MEILIRPWRADDFAAVRRILWESWIAAYGTFIPEEDLRAYLEATYRIESLRSLYESPLIHGFIGEADGEAAGYARTQFDKMENRISLASLYLRPGFQGKGIGGRLLKAAEEKALSCGLRVLWVGVMVQNVAARLWYEKRGFRFLREEPFKMARVVVPHLIGCKEIEPSSRSAAFKRRVVAAFDGKAMSPSLGEMAGRLLEGQKKTWRVLAEGYAALDAARHREVREDGWVARVQWNPRRLASSSARVDGDSIRKRPCFLCADNLPREQEAILYRDDYLVLANPAPILPGHLTIAHRHHVPQSIQGNGEAFLRLAEDFGPGMIVFYNGPRSGASAPDHLHFQAAPAGILPVEAAVGKRANRRRARRLGGAALSATAGLGRGMIVIEGRTLAGVAAGLDRVIGALGRAGSGDGEPLLNLVCTYAGERWRLIVFPRLKHRPDAYFREGAERLLISPGAVDMGGLFVTPREEDFLALDRDLVAHIYREVAFDDAAVAALVDAL